MTRLIKKKHRTNSQVSPENGFDGEARFLASLFIKSPIGIYIVQDKKICFVNPELQKITEYSEDELMGMESMRLIFAQDQKMVRENAIKMLKMKIHAPYEYRAIRKYGEIRWIYEMVTSVQYKGSRAILGHFMDITERKKAEQALEKAYGDLQHEMSERKRQERTLMQEEKFKTLGAIAAEVAHEIRNPLTAIGGFARRLKEKQPDLPECDIILKESKRLENILSRIKDYLEPVDINLSPCSINMILSSCVKRLFPETGAGKIICDLNLDEKIPDACADKDLLAQVFNNLIRNACHSLAEGETLFIKTFESEHELHIEFKNRTLDRKPGDSEKLFLPFAEGSRSIGLPFCYRLLKDMGGVLSFVYDYDSMVFTVSLPKAENPDKRKNIHG